MHSQCSSVKLDAAADMTVITPPARPQASECGPMCPVRYGMNQGQGRWSGQLFCKISHPCWILALKYSY